MFELTIISPLAGLISMIIAGLIYFYIKRQPEGAPLMQELEVIINQGTMAFLKREYIILALFTFCVILVLRFLFRDWQTPAAFISGILSSVIVIHLGVKAATRGNSRTAEAADRSGKSRALAISYFSGSITGISVAALGLVGLGAWFWWFGKGVDIVRYLSGFAMGVSSVALFIRIGGGVFAKAADLGSDMAVRIEPGISQDDFRNPGVIAENVGDTVGNIAGMGADLFESYVAGIIASIVIGAFMTIAPGFPGHVSVPDDGDHGTFLYIGLPLLIAVAGQISSFVGIISIKALRGRKPATALRSTIFIADSIFSLLSALIIWLMQAPWGVFWALFSGVICGIATGLLAEYSTSGPSASRISEQARSGPATVVISGLAAGMLSTSLPVLVICAVIFTGYCTAGIYGLGIAAVGMLATAGVSMTVDAYGSIAGNAGGISVISGLGVSTRRITGNLDLMGNTTAFIGKGFASGSAALAAIALFAAYTSLAGLKTISITDPRVVAGVLIGAMIPMMTAAVTVSSVGRAALKIVEEIRRQFRETPGLLAGQEGVRPDAGACVSIATGAAIKEMIIPGLLALICPVAVGVLLGSEALGGMILGTSVMGIFLSIFMSNSGGAWDNARKYIESGNFGGKDSGNHRAAAVGARVGYPLKDAAGPAMNSLIKVVAVVSLIIAPFLKQGGLFWGS